MPGKKKKQKNQGGKVPQKQKAVAKGGGSRGEGSQAGAGGKDKDKEEQVIVAASYFDEDAFLDEAIKIVAAEKKARWVNGCDHGMLNCDARAQSFIDAFTDSFIASANRTGKLVESLNTAEEVTDRKFADVVNHLPRMEAIVSYFLMNGAEAALRGYDTDVGREDAGWNASLACYFEQRAAVYICKTQSSLNTRKIFELHRPGGDKRTVISFLRKRICCTCLDDKYKEVKVMKKLCVCVNHQSQHNGGTCMLPKGEIERKKMLLCSGCKQVYYCSRRCQKDHWPKHKDSCKFFVSEKAKFDSGKQ